MVENDYVESTNARKVIDEAQLKQMLAQESPTFVERNKSRVVTLVLIALNVVIFAVEVFLSGFRTNISSSVLLQMGAMCAPFVQTPADWYRFVTPMFLHMDFMHLAFNMVALYSVGEVLERVLGKGNFIALYFIAGITGNAISYVASITVGYVYTVSAGASTSVFGLFVAVALLMLLHKGNRSMFMQVSKSMLGIIAVNVAYTFLVPSISVSGHLGGALGGLMAMFMVPSKNLRVPSAVRVVVALVWVVAIGFILFTSVTHSFLL